jgi:CoA:oxalate CoA-transferase
MRGALESIKVLDLTHHYAGPFCTLLLRDLGAEIVKVERPIGGDPVRTQPPLTQALESAPFIMLNRGKKSITLNLQAQKGRDIFRALVKKVDVVVENFSPGTMDKLSLGSEELCRLNPKLIYASISGFGQTGPRHADIAFDPVIQAMAGLVSITGFSDGPATKAGVPIADFLGGVFAALAIMAALHFRSRTGKGQTVDISLQDCLFLLTAIWCGPSYFVEGRVPQRYGNGDEWVTPSNLYAAKDGAVLILAPVLAQVQRLFRTIGREDLMDSPLASQASERIKHKQEIDASIEEWTKSRSVEEIMDELKKAGVACSRVPTLDQVCNDPQLLSRQMIIGVEQLLSGKVNAPGSVFKLSKTPGNAEFPSPSFGEHNFKVLSGILGYSEREIRELVNDGII